MQITDAGHALLEQVGRMQARTAQTVSEGVPSEDYETVLRTLTTMLDNLKAGNTAIGEGVDHGLTGPVETRGRGRACPVGLAC